MEGALGRRGRMSKLGRDANKRMCVCGWEGGWGGAQVVERGREHLYFRERERDTCGGYNLYFMLMTHSAHSHIGAVRPIRSPALGSGGVLFHLHFRNMFLPQKISCSPAIPLISSVSANRHCVDHSLSHGLNRLEKTKENVN